MNEKRLLIGIFITILIFLVIDAKAFASKDKISQELADFIHQASYDLKPIKVWIYFTNKDLNQDQALIRNKKQVNRLRKAGIIGFNNEDIPVNIEYINTLSEMKIYPVTLSRWLNAVSANVSVKKIYELENLEFIKKLDVVRTHFRKPEIDLATTNQSTGSKKSLLYGNSFDQLQTINFPLADELGFSGKNVRICIMDTGFNVNHESLRYSKIVSAYDFISKDYNINLQEQDAYGSTDHGTAVFSVMSGFLPGKLVGPAFGADYILARTEEISSNNNIAEDLWVSAVEWADSLGADIVLFSAGLMFENIFNDSMFLNDNDKVEESVVYKIVKTGISRGVLFVTDAPDNYNETVMQELKKSGLDMLFVASSTPPDADDLSAPALFDSAFKPSEKTGLAIRSSLNNVYTAEAGGDNFYGWRSGSSYIAAIAAASAAILFEAHPDWSTTQALESLRVSCIESNSTEGREDKKESGFIDIFAAMNIVFPSISGDFDGNGRVDGNDLAIFSSFYLKSADDPKWNKSADIDGNMVVDGDDLAIFINRFITN
jgi:serine protease AprX